MFPTKFNHIHHAVVAGLVLFSATPAVAQDYTLRTMIGTLGSGNSQFRTPEGIAIGGDQAIFVIDSNLNKVQKFDLAGGFLSSWGGAGEANGKFNNPTDAIEGPSGNIYIVDTANHRVQYFTPSGQFIQNFGTGGTTPGKFNTPLGIASFGSDRIYVTDSLNHRVQILGKSGDFIAAFGTYGVNAGELDNPAGIAVNQTTGDVYVADTGNNRIQVFSKDGTYKRQWGTFGVNYGQFANIGGIAIDKQGNVFVADTANVRVQVFNASGAFFNSIEGPFGQARTFLGPRRVAVDRYGSLYVTDSGGSTSATQRFMIFDPLGVDNRPPVTTIAYSRERASGQWFAGPVDVTLTAADVAGGSGVKSITYKVDGGQPTTYQGNKLQLDFTSDGLHSLSYFATDIAGNIEPEQSIRLDIDSVPPTLDASSTPDGKTITLTAADSLSGIDRVLYRLDGGSEQVYSFPIVLDGKRHKVVAASMDKASNTSATNSIVVNIAPLQVTVPSSSPGGYPVPVIVRLTDPAPAGGLSVAMTSSSTVFVVPASIPFAAGESEKWINVTPTPVAVTSPITITATANAQTVVATINIVPPSVQTISSNPSVLTGGESGIVRVALNAPAPKAGTTIALGSSSSSLVIASKATVAAGKQLVDIPYKTLPVGGTNDKIARVTATTELGGGAAVAVDITLQRPTIKSISATPPLVAGGKPVSLTITFTGAIPATGAQLTLASNSAAISVPKTVTLKANATSATVPCTTSTVATRTPVVITAELHGKSSETTVAVRTIEVLKLTPNPLSLQGGVTGKLTITLTEAVPKGQTVSISLSSNVPVLTLPATLSIPAGKSSAIVDMQSNTVGQLVTANVTAMVNGGSTSQSIQIKPVEVSKLSFLPTSVKGGISTQATITLASNATIDTVVNLASSTPASASVPATVTVPKGSKTATFTVTTATVTANKSVKISAVSGTVVVAATLNVLK
ncbi:MAG: OmpL47-type beta-barrel domain-containing protein [Armatimonadota bacterium]